MSLIKVRRIEACQCLAEYEAIRRWLLCCETGCFLMTEKSSLKLRTTMIEHALVSRRKIKGSPYYLLDVCFSFVICVVVSLMLYHLFCMTTFPLPGNPCFCALARTCGVCVVMLRAEFWKAK